MWETTFVSRAAMANALLHSRPPSYHSQASEHQVIHPPPPPQATQQTSTPSNNENSNTFGSNNRAVANHILHSRHAARAAGSSSISSRYIYFPYN